MFHQDNLLVILYRYYFAPGTSVPGAPVGLRQTLPLFNKPQHATNTFRASATIAFFALNPFVLRNRSYTPAAQLLYRSIAHDASTSALRNTPGPCFVTRPRRSLVPD
jgi:hypothetical protein